MSNDTKWLIGTGVVLAGLLSAQTSGLGTSLNARIDDLNASLSSRMDRLENRFDGLDERFRNVEIGLGKVEQRLLTIERVVLPGSDQSGE
ncbi:MAG: hypothetical protein OXH75_18105 [Acidobacteria bacterium]|nr:hypothetical protein [Acidobacteriota bacterium]